MLKKIILSVLVVFLFSFTLSASNFYSDPRYKGWVNDFHLKKFDEVIKSVESDYVTADKHPMCIPVWISSHMAAGSIERALSDDNNPIVADAAIAYEIMVDYDEQRYYEVFEKYTDIDELLKLDPYTIFYWINCVDDIVPFQAFELVKKNDKKQLINKMPDTPIRLKKDFIKEE